ncbi:conserved hypothetical protein [uncultured Paludibacter sp.]|uniref:Uncharacterized protein n=1 Tax=uncultured Paludibacter sp. TaxID=497635 RepID=A0A653ALH7_9BACT|nr:conserved hypothetical protein [uncultured Paludibacter sp.]
MYIFANSFLNMKCKIVKIPQLSGKAASVYSVVLEGDTDTGTLLNKFVTENEILFKSETIDILKRLHTIGHLTGCREQFFKDNEGKPGDGVCAIYDEDSKLRLYCIRYGTQLIVVGSGGKKPKSIRALQESDKLKDENYFLRNLSVLISERIQEKEIRFSDDGMDFIGDLEFNDEE